MILQPCRRAQREAVQRKRVNLEMMLVTTEVSGHLPYGVTKTFIQKMISAAYKYVDGKKPVHVAVSVVDDKVMRALNKQHRGMDRTTDVLSFPYSADQEFVEIKDETGHELLGELVISAEQIKRQAKQINRRIRDEFALMLVHGTLHLLGYDHTTQEEENTMFIIQQDVLTEEGIF